MLEFPLNYIYITQLYKEGVHNGVDIIGESGDTLLIAPQDGVVESVRNDYVSQDSRGNSYGNYVKIDHGNGIKTLVAHLKYNSVRVIAGQNVKKGDILGIMGTTGHSTGVHVHYEVFINNKKVNPLDYTYANNNQIIHNKSIPYIKRLNYNLKDESINQVFVKISDLNIRTGPGLNYNIIGTAHINTYYNYKEYKHNDGYDWYSIGDNKWIANNGEFLEVFKANNEIENKIKFEYEVKEDNTYLIKLKKGEKLVILETVN